MKDMDRVIKKVTEEVFNVNNSNTEDINVLAAMIAASAGISISGGISNEQMVKEGLISVYDQKDNEELGELINMMAPQNVKANIGFAVDYRDYNQAKTFYEANQETLNKYYTLINERSRYLNESHSL